jgi:hypothetical protein
MKTIGHANLIQILKTIVEKAVNAVDVTSITMMIHLVEHQVI